MLGDALLAVWDPLAATSGLWFTMVSVAAGVLAPAVEIIPSGAAQTALLAAAAVFVLVQAVRLADRLGERLS